MNGLNCRCMGAFTFLGCMILASAIGSSSAWGQAKSSKEIIQKKKVKAEDAPPEFSAPKRESRPPSKVIVPKKANRKHIRLALPTDDRNEVDFRSVLTRSTRSLGFSIEYFDEPRRREIDEVIRCFRENRRDEGYQHWNRFVVSLETFDKPVDLEPVMYHVLREGCLRQDPSVLFHAEKLERARGDMENIEEYWDDLYRLHNQCRSPGAGCLEPFVRRIEDELQMLGQERGLARAKVMVAQRAMERAQLNSSGDVAQSVDVFYTVAQEITRRTEYVLYSDTE